MNVRIFVIALFLASTVFAQDNNSLILAAREGDVAEVQRLIESGADINLQDNQGKTALMWAVAVAYPLVDRIEVVNLLIKAGADVNMKDNKGRVALGAAAIYGRTEMARLLIKAGADVDVKAGIGAGNTALMWAAWEGHTELVNLLIEAGADVNVQDNYGATALVKAIKRPGNVSVEVVNLLIEAGADVNIKDNREDTALIWASRFGHTEIARMLIEAGANE